MEVRRSAIAVRVRLLTYTASAPEEVAQVVAALDQNLKEVRAQHPGSYCRDQ